VHAQSDFGTFAETARVFRRNGYQHVYTAEDREILSRATHPLVKTWGVYDEDLFAAIVAMLKEGKLPSPFLLTVATTDTHFPYAVLRQHPGTGGNPLLDALHGTDAGFGAFWDYFRESPYAKDTLVLVTADHALVRRALRYAEGGARLSQLDWLAGLMLVPGDPRWRGSTVEVPCSQLDLVPTLLDVMDIDVENPFLGLSVFSDRPGRPLLLGREPPPEDRFAAPDRAALAAVGFSDDDRARLLAWLTQLARADRVRPEGPVRAHRVAGWPGYDGPLHAFAP
jgi:phosphoglycerol transferase MdoB-like AlkP superfamily enzyme